MTRPYYTSAAQNDLADIVGYIARDKPAAALAWVEKIEAKCMFLARAPHVGELKSEFGEGVRVFSVGRYLIFYRKFADRVEILRVLAGDRDIKEL